MSRYVLEMYRQMFISLKRGNTKGVFSNAKPIFLLSILKYIDNCNSSNSFVWGNEIFESIYKSISYEFGYVKSTPLWKPFYYMSSEPFYTLVWSTLPDMNLLKFPSGKILKDYLSHAKLDDQLWELLRDKENREYLKDSIVTHYLSHK